MFEEIAMPKYALGEIEHGKPALTRGVWKRAFEPAEIAVSIERTTRA